MGKSNRSYDKYKRYLKNSYEDVHGGKWTMKPIPGRQSADSSSEQKAPGTVAGAQTRAQPPATAAANAEKGGGKKAGNATPRQCFNCGEAGHVSRDCKSPPSAETLAARTLKCWNCKGLHKVSECPEPVLKCGTCERYGHLDGQCPPVKADKTSKNVKFSKKGSSAGVSCLINANPLPASPAPSVSARTTQGSASMAAPPVAAIFPPASDDAHWAGTAQDPCLFPL